MILSIIIPCYNSGKFIKKTLENLTSQKLDNCEIILVNDGSTDNTLSILNEYSDYRQNVIIVNQENQGVSIARNNGIKHAIGKYIYFLDSDDELADDAVEYITTKIIDNLDCQILGFGYKVFKNDRSCIDYCCKAYNNVQLSGISALKFFLDGYLRLNICSLAISRTFIINNQVFFEKDHKIGEDILFICKLLYAGDSFRYFAHHCFTYIFRSDSVTSGGNKFSIINLETQEYLRPFLSSVSKEIPALKNDINYFLMLRWAKAFLSYLRTSTIDKRINVLLIELGDIRFKPNYIGNIKMWILMKLAACIPLKLMFFLLKRTN